VTAAGSAALSALLGGRALPAVAAPRHGSGGGGLGATGLDLGALDLDARTAAWLAGLLALAFLFWALSLRRRLSERLALEREIRRDAIERSGAAIRGRVSETFAPFAGGWEFEPGDCRFLGTPVDFVVFDGLHEGRCDRVVLVEVKSGGSALTPRERQVRDAVLAGRVEWREVRLE
jgi:hypothetical protein